MTPCWRLSQETEHGYEWDNFSPYTCTVTSPKKETKMKGLKSFIAYQLVPSFSNIQVREAVLLARLPWSCQ